MELITAAADKYLQRYKVWKDKRLYVHKCRFTTIYNTRKCEQTVYIDLVTYNVHCDTNCPAQSTAWENNENQRVVNALQGFARLLRVIMKAQRLATDPVNIIVNNAILNADRVKGYFTTWKKVQVKINRFGKLAERNRLFVVPFDGTKETAPAGFVSLTELGYRLLISRCKSDGEMIEPYGEIPDYDELGIVLAVN